MLQLILSIISNKILYWTNSKAIIIYLLKLKQMMTHLTSFKTLRICLLFQLSIALFIGLCLKSDIFSNFFVVYSLWRPRTAILGPWMMQVPLFNGDIIFHFPVRCNFYDGSGQFECNVRDFFSSIDLLRLFSENKISVDDAFLHRFDLFSNWPTIQYSLE